MASLEQPEAMLWRLLEKLLPDPIAAKPVEVRVLASLWTVPAIAIAGAHARCGASLERAALP